MEIKFYLYSRSPNTDMREYNVEFVDKHQPIIHI